MTPHRPTLLLQIRIVVILITVTCVMMGSPLVLILAVTASLWTLSYHNSLGNFLTPSAMVGLFAPLRLLGSIGANDGLAALAEPREFLLTDETRTMMVLSVSLLVLAANISVIRSRRPQLGLRMGTRLAVRRVAWAAYGVALGSWIVLAGHVPIFSDDAENSRVVALAGSANLVYIAWAAASVIACISAAERGANGSKQLIPGDVAIAAAGLVIIGNRLPAVLVGLTWLAVFATFRQAQSRRVPWKHVAGGILALFIFAPIFGAFRATYVGLEKGWSGVYVHFLNRVAADAGNTERVLSAVDRLPSGWSILAKPFWVYAPGAQLNLGQYLKEALGLVFSGGGITVTLPAEAALVVGPGGSLIFVVLVGILCRVLSEVAFRSKSFAHNPAIWTASTAFANLGPAGIAETIANGVLPLGMISLLIIASARVYASAATHHRSTHGGITSTARNVSSRSAQSVRVPRTEVALGDDAVR